MQYENRYQRYLELGEIDRLIKNGEISFDNEDMIVFKDTKKRCIGCGDFMGDKDHEEFCYACKDRERDAYEKDEHKADTNCEL